MKQPELGKKIAEIRKSKGLTQEDLVGMCNISVRTIQRIETGEVTPRSYTIKTILSALGSDLKNVEEKEEASFQNSNKVLQFAWISGIIFLLLGLLEGFLNIMRISNNLIGSFFTVSGNSDSFYPIIKLLVLGSYIFFLKGFFVLGGQIHNSLLKIVSVILISLMILSTGNDIIFMSNNPLNAFSENFAAFGISVALGFAGIIFGAALIKSRIPLGSIAIFAGIVEITIGLFSFFQNPLGIPLQVLAIILQVIIIYKAIPRPRPTAAQLA